MLGISDKTFAVLGKIWLVLFLVGLVAGIAVQAMAYATAQRTQQLGQPTQ